MQKPPDQFQPASAKMMVHNLGVVLLTAVATTSCFWSMLFRRPGSVGTRAYALEMFLSTLLILMLANAPGERPYFIVALVLMYAGYIKHNLATGASKEHVHTQCVGGYRYSKTGSVEGFLGLAIGGAAYYLGLPYFGGFVAASALCCGIRDSLIQERDKLRATQMADAIAEQEYMMKIYERFKK